MHDEAQEHKSKKEKKERVMFPSFDRYDYDSAVTWMKPSSDSFIYFWFDQYLLSILESWYIKKKTMNIVKNNKKAIPFW